jgi:succinate dehydrogenase cytochrome b556 subunit
MTRVTRLGGYSAWAWILQAASGALLVILLALHMTAQHFVAPGGVLNYDEVVAHLKNPIIFVLETAFAGTVLFHAFAGIRAILLDLGLSRVQERPINIVLTVLGIGLFVYGLVLTLAVATR